jgi:hypothetical protein
VIIGLSVGRTIPPLTRAGFGASEGMITEPYG